MLRLPSFGRDARVNTLICSGHFPSHYYRRGLRQVRYKAM
jgi:hypothetical protein